MSEAHPQTLDQQMQRIEALIESLEKLSNPAARVVARELVQTLLHAQGVGLHRMLEIAEAHGAGAAIAAWGADNLVGNLLMLHGLHPVSLTTRAQQAIDSVRPLLRCQGGELELVTVTEQRVRVRLRGSCALSGAELEHTLEEAFASCAPDVQVIEVESADSPAQRLALPLL
jgi:Fe-S cluster biogenesis protein NfuA